MSALRAALVCLALIGGLFVPASAVAASVDSVAFSSDPTEDEPVSVTVSGSTEAARTLFVLLRSGSGACAATANAEYYARSDTTELSGSVTWQLDGDAVASGNFSRTYTFTPAAAGAYRVCAYVAETPTGVSLSTKWADLVVRRPSASAAISGSAPYLKGQVAALLAVGQTEHAATFASSVEAGERECSVAGLPYGSRQPLSPGSFSIPIDFTYGAEPAHTVCFFIFNENDSTPLAVIRHVARKLPLDPPSLSGQIAVTGRKPTFSWATGTSGTDTLAILEQGTPVMYVTEAGTLVPMEPREVEIEDVGDYLGGGDGGARADQGADPELGRIERHPDGTSVVALKKALPPGRYAWQVVRERDPGEIAISSNVSFEVNGPPLTRLSVSVRQHLGRTSRRPGYTVLVIRSTPYARVTVTLARGGRTRRLPFSWGSRAVGRQRVDWSCALTGGYRYVVEAEDHLGTKLRRTGRFSGATASRCASMQAAERRARARRIAAEQRRLREIARREAAAERARAIRFINNCRALGGTPVRVSLSIGPRIMCRAPYGGYLIVPT